MAITRELRISAEIWSRDAASGLRDLADTLGEMPESYRLTEIDVTPLDRGTDTLARGFVVAIVTAILELDGPRIFPRPDGRPLRDTLEKVQMTVADTIRKKAAEAGIPPGEIEADPFPGPTGNGTEDIREIEAWYRRHPDSRGVAMEAASGIMSDVLDKIGGPGNIGAFETLAEAEAAKEKAARLQYARETGGHPGDMPRDYDGLRPVHPADVSVYIDPPSGEIGDPERRESILETFSKLAEAQARAEANVKTVADALQFDTEAAKRNERDARREFQIETIRAMLRQQDHASGPSGGVRPFPDRMTFARTVGDVLQCITTMIPEPGGRELNRYRDLVKGIAANCVRELERTAQEGRAAL